MTAAANGCRFTDQELDRAVRSLQNLTESLDFDTLRAALAESAHLSHKDWAVTEKSSAALAALLPGGPDDPTFRALFQRVLGDGGWDAAAAAAADRPTGCKPWAVLVTGVNGIRKTTCMYQKWFKQALAEALTLQGEDAVPPKELPDGDNSFFRQLDYVIATVANEDFRMLYQIDDVETYAKMKDSIFTRYRTIAEMWGMVLVREAQKRQMNVMVETSGRDPAMLGYMDHLFPDDQYRKLIVHFTINEIEFAEDSVDTRMLGEMESGRKASGAAGDTLQLISANAGGPYGSNVLRQVEEQSNKVWRRVLDPKDELGKGWTRASIRIEAQPSLDWTARASTGRPEDLAQEQTQYLDDDFDVKPKARSFVILPR